MGIGGELEPEVVDGGWIRDDVPVIQLETESEAEVPDPIPTHQDKKFLFLIALIWSNS